MRLTVTVDEHLLDEATKVCRAKSKREAIEIALKDLVRRRRLEQATGHAGRVNMAVTVDELLRERAAE